MAYFIVTYDIAEKRVNKVRKTLKKYFIWVQNSVFEGDIQEGIYKKCCEELKEIIDKEEDSIYFFKFDNRLNFEKEVIGVEKVITDNIL